MRNKRNSILITSACGVAARAIVRSLRKSPEFRDAKYVGTDVCRNLYGIAEGMYQEVVKLPYYDEPGYESIINAVCEEHKIDFSIVTHDLEVMYWSTRVMPVPCLLPPPKFCTLAGSKAMLYETLAKSGYIPWFKVYRREALMEASAEISGWLPCWIRDIAVGAAGGRGAFLARSVDELKAWAMLNIDSEMFMVSEYLPGRNYACQLLYFKGDLAKVGIYERLEYFLGRMIPSGVSGNISRGRLLNDARVLEVSKAAVDSICSTTGEDMHGFITVDLKEDAKGVPKVTEINLRHVACTSAFADAGHNMSEAHAFATISMPERIGAREAGYPPGNYILRDIDGPPLWVSEIAVPAAGGRVKVAV